MVQLESKISQRDLLHRPLVFYKFTKILKEELIKFDNEIDLNVVDQSIYQFIQWCLAYQQEDIISSFTEMKVQEGSQINKYSNMNSDNSFESSS